MPGHIIVYIYAFILQVIFGITQNQKVVLGMCILAHASTSIKLGQIWAWLGSLSRSVSSPGQWCWTGFNPDGICPNKTKYDKTCKSYLCLHINYFIQCWYSSMQHIITASELPLFSKSLGKTTFQNRKLFYFATGVDILYHT